MTIPIFIITRDRVSVLKKSIASYKPLGDIEIVIHDNHSTYPPMLEYLANLEKQGIKIYRYGEDGNGYNEISERVQQTILSWYKSNDSDHYIVTDPDIELENPSPELLNFYTSVLKTYNSAPVVGPMLRIDDLPECFRIRDEMIESHMIQFWGPQHQRIDFNGTKIQKAGIDTTFGMYRKGFRFKRLNFGIRVHDPYMARHLDWYMDTDNPTEEQRYYIANCSHKISTLSAHVTRGGMK